MTRIEIVGEVHGVVDEADMRSRVAELVRDERYGDGMIARVSVPTGGAPAVVTFEFVMHSAHDAPSVAGTVAVDLLCILTEMKTGHVDVRWRVERVLECGSVCKEDVIDVWGDAGSVRLPLGARRVRICT